MEMRRCVTLTKESMFYVPEDNCPYKATLSNINGKTESLESKTDTSYQKKNESAPSVLEGGLGVVSFLLLLLLLIVLMVYFKETFALNSAFVVVGVALGYMWGAAGTHKTSD